MAEFKSILIESPSGISVYKGKRVEVVAEVKNSREQILKELGLEINEDKMAVRQINYILGRNEHIYFNVEIAPGIKITENRWAQKNLYKTGDPFEVFDKKSKDNGSCFYTPRLKDGAYLHFSAFGFVLGYDKDKDFDKTFTLLAEKAGKSEQQKGTFSIPNNGYERGWTEKGLSTDEVPISTKYFRKAIESEVTSTLRLDKNKIKGYTDIGLSFMPGSIDAGGLVVVEMSYNDLSQKYKEIKTEADRNPDKAWKTPLIVRTRELSDFLLDSNNNINSILCEDSLGKVIRSDRFESYYKRALENRL